MSFEVSVIIPVYNARRFLQKSIQSALDQEEVKEVLVIDDGSTDGSYELLQSWNEQEERIQLFTHANRENLGPGPSRNVGIENASCEYVAFLDADDYYLPNRFVLTKDIINKSMGKVGVFEPVLNIYENSNKVELKQLLDSDGNVVGPNQVFEFLLKNRFNYFLMHGCCFNRCATIDVGQFDNLLYMQDTLFYLKYANKYPMIGVGNSKPVAHRIIHIDNSIHKVYERRKLKRLFGKELFQFISSNKPSSTNYHLFRRIILCNGASYRSRLIRYIAYFFSSIYLSIRYNYLFIKSVVWRINRS